MRELSASGSVEEVSESALLPEAVPVLSFLSLNNSSAPHPHPIPSSSGNDLTLTNPPWAAVRSFFFCSLYLRENESPEFLPAQL